LSAGDNVRSSGIRSIMLAILATIFAFCKWPRQPA
jgi:hypothetical protein